MAAGPVTQVADVVVPEVFTPYVQQLTEQKARLVQSGVLVRNPLLDQLLAGGGLTFNVPSFRDLDDDADNVSTDEVADIIALSESAGTPAFPGSFNDSIPRKIETDAEIAVRLNRNQSWSSSDLAVALAGQDPQAAIAARVAFYWMRRMQAIFIAMLQGISRDNGTNDSGDYSNDITGGSFVDGVTNFTAEAFLDAQNTMGDSSGDLAAMMVHSTVMTRMKKNNLIDFIPDARGETTIPVFQGLEVIEDDGMPSGTNVVLGDGTAGSAGMFETWLFGAGQVQWGVASPKVPTEVSREAAAGNGGGQEILHSRVQWTMHSIGQSYTGTPANGGPANGTGANDLGNAGSWDRVYPERKQIKFARLITRES